MIIKKLPSRYMHFVMPFIVSIFMSCLVSGVSTLRGIGLSADFFHVWMGAWGLSWVVAFPILLIVLPTARKIASLVVETP